MSTTTTHLAATLIIVSSISATVLHCLGKWGFYAWYEEHRRLSWPKEICLFCLGFWLSALQYLALYLFYTSEIFYIAGALASASLTKAIYENGKVRIR